MLHRSQTCRTHVLINNKKPVFTQIKVGKEKKKKLSSWQLVESWASRFQVFEISLSEKNLQLTWNRLEKMQVLRDASDNDKNLGTLLPPWWCQGSLHHVTSATHGTNGFRTIFWDPPVCGGGFCLLSYAPSRTGHEPLGRKRLKGCLGGRGGPSAGPRAFHKPAAAVNSILMHILPFLNKLPQSCSLGRPHKDCDL